MHTSSKHKTLNATQETMKKSGKKEGEISTMPIVNKGNNIKHQQQHRETTQPAYYSYDNTVRDSNISNENVRFLTTAFQFLDQGTEREKKKKIVLQSFSSFSESPFILCFNFEL